MILPLILASLTFFRWPPAAESARILIVVPTPSISHSVIYRPFSRELASRGHRVVVITADPMADASIANLTEIDVHDISYNIWHKKDVIGGGVAVTSWMQVSIVHSLLLEVADAQLAHPQVQALIKDRNEHFDLVILESLTFQCMLGFRERFRCPLIGITSMGLLLNAHEAIGNPTHPAVVLDYMPVSGDLTLMERLANIFYALEFRYYYHTDILPQHNAIARKYFGNTISDVGDIEKRTDLVLINTNPIFHLPRPFVPAVIEIGGIHITPRKPLPKDIQQIMDDAREGIIYFSLGSNVRLKTVNPEVLTTLINTFAKLPYTFICSWSGNLPPTIPKNIIMKEWLPQRDILDHPNVKAFITQGGLQSTEEAINSKVPLIGIPFGGDQYYNVARYVSLQIGKRILQEDITEDLLSRTINEVIHNPIYKVNIVKLAALLWDQPNTPLERGIWWIEYVLRHGGAAHLHSPIIDMTWAQYFMLDIIALILAVVCIVSFTVRYLTKTMLQRLKCISRPLQSHMKFN